MLGKLDCTHAMVNFSVPSYNGEDLTTNICSALLNLLPYKPN